MGALFRSTEGGCVGDLSRAAASVDALRRRDPLPSPGVDVARGDALDDREDLAQIGLPLVAAERLRLS